MPDIINNLFELIKAAAEEAHKSDRALLELCKAITVRIEEQEIEMRKLKEQIIDARQQIDAVITTIVSDKKVN